MTPVTLWTVKVRGQLADDLTMELSVESGYWLKADQARALADHLLYVLDAIEKLSSLPG